MRIAIVCSAFFSFFPCVCRLPMLFICVPLTLGIFMDSATSVIGSLGGSGVPCHFPSVILCHCHRGLSARNIALSP